MRPDLTQLDVIVYPDPRLKQPSDPVVEFDPWLKDLSLRMLDLMRKHAGVGLAAPQVGINLRLFVMNHDGAPDNDRVFVNPRLTQLSDDDVTAEEGCLSIPGVNAEVTRIVRTRIEAVDVDNTPIDDEDDGFRARIWQHEVDHLDGMLITDRMGLGDKLANRKTLRELREKFEQRRGIS